MTSNGQDMIISVSNYSSTEEASSAFKTLSAPDSRSTLAPESVTHFGQQAATVALGHAPSTVQDVYIRGTGDYAGIDNEYIQYDQLLIAINMVPAQTCRPLTVAVYVSQLAAQYGVSNSTVLEYVLLKNWVEVLRADSACAIYNTL
jgi:hypothetical protein